MMLVKQSAMQRNKRLPLLIVKPWLRRRIALHKRGLLVIDLDTLGFNHYKTGIYAFNLCYKLLLGDGPCLWLKNDVILFTLGS